jgi:hypothetical protein
VGVELKIAHSDVDFAVTDCGHFTPFAAAALHCWRPALRQPANLKVSKISIGNVVA